MKVVQSDIWLCDDCLSPAVNDDYTGLDYHYNEPEASRRMREIENGLNALGPNLVPNWHDEDMDACDVFPREAWVAAVVAGETDKSHEDWADRQMEHEGRGYEEFSRRDCDCCRSTLAGSRHRFAILGEDNEAGN